MEGDCWGCRGGAVDADFYPRPPHGGRRWDTICGRPTGTVFYPRPPHGGRQFVDRRKMFLSKFLPTPSTWRATNRYIPPRAGAGYFYPRPHMEGDGSSAGSAASRGAFLPTPSHGGRLLAGSKYDPTAKFLPTPSHGGRRTCVEISNCTNLFLPTPSHGGRPRGRWGLPPPTG